MTAVLTSWYKSEGDVVSAGELICELRTERATLDVQAPHAGVLRKLKYAGARVSIDESVARIEPFHEDEGPRRP